MLQHSSVAFQAYLPLPSQQTAHGSLGGNIGYSDSGMDIGSESVPEGGANHSPLAAAFRSLQRIHQSLDLGVVLSTTVAEVRQLLQVERVFLFRFEPDWSGVVVVEDCASGCLPLQGQQMYDECFAEQWVSAYTQGRVQTVGDVE